MARPWRRRAVSLAEALGDVARAIGMEGCLREIEVRRVWPRAVGPTTAEHARPAGLQGATLLVHVTDSAWLHRLSMARRDIIRNLNDHLGAPAIKAVRLRIGLFDEPPAGGRALQGAAPGRRLATGPTASAAPDPAVVRAVAPVKDLPFGEVVQRILDRQTAMRGRH